MSAYFKAWGTVLATCPDPSTYDTEPPAVVGHMATGRPVAQGFEQGVLTWQNITLAQWIDLHARWLSNYTASGSFDIPPRASGGSWTSWRTVTAYAEEPVPHYEGRVITGATMRLIVTA